MATHMVRRLGQSSLTSVLRRRQTIRLLTSTAPRAIFAATKYQHKPALLRPNLVENSPFFVRFLATTTRTLDDLREQVLNVVKLFDKVNAEQVMLESHFINDLGLDSLDVVEIVMAFEDEFAVEISDEEAEKIHTVANAVEFLQKALGVH